MNILLIDDDLETFFVLNSALDHRFTLTHCTSIDSAFEKINHQPVELVFLDVTLPDANGFHIFPKLRSHPQLVGVPIYFLTGKNEITDRVAGFALGADDYITKPFEPLELRARIESRLAASRTRKQENMLIRKGRLEIDHSKMRAFSTGIDQSKKDLFLTPYEFRLLASFITHEGNVLSRNQLITAAWGSNTHVLERTVDRHISSLRKKLDQNFEKIEAIHGVGYRFSLVNPPL